MDVRRWYAEALLSSSLANIADVGQPCYLVDENSVEFGEWPMCQDSDEVERHSVAIAHAARLIRAGVQEHETKSLTTDVGELPAELDIAISICSTFASISSWLQLKLIPPLCFEKATEIVKLIEFALQRKWGKKLYVAVGKRFIKRAEMYCECFSFSKHSSVRVF